MYVPRVCGSCLCVHTCVPVRACAPVRAHDDYVCTARGYVPPVKACDTPDRVGGSERGSVSVSERARARTSASVSKRGKKIAQRGKERTKRREPKDRQHKLKERNQRSTEGKSRDLEGNREP